MQSIGCRLNHTLLVEAATYKSHGYVAATDSGEEFYSLSPTRRVRSRMWRSDIERRSKRAPNGAPPSSLRRGVAEEPQPCVDGI
jgi:hypothetical protein